MHKKNKCKKRIFKTMKMKIQIEIIHILYPKVNQIVCKVVGIWISEIRPMQNFKIKCIFRTIYIRKIMIWNLISDSLVLFMSKAAHLNKMKIAVSKTLQTKRLIWNFYKIEYLIKIKAHWNNKHFYTNLKNKTKSINQFKMDNNLRYHII